MASLSLTSEQLAVSIESKEGELRIDSRIVADGFGLKSHKDYRNNILEKYETKFLELGGVLKTPPDSGEIVWYLNEDQFNFAGTLARNTAKAVEFKLNLVKAFKISRKKCQDKLESQFGLEVRDVPLKQINELAELMGKYYGAAYAQRLVVLNVNKFHPHLALPQAAPEEKASVSTGSALLTPTQIAEQVGFFCKSSPESGDARRVNKLLEQLGYQVKIAGIWSATSKAIELKLCDRKPVDTKSRTQKDQLLWSSDVLAILSEHTLES